MGSVKAFALDKGIRLADLSCQAKAVKQTMLRAWRKTEDYSDAIMFAVRKHPGKSICITFGSAFILGAAAGWLVKRSR